MQRHGLQIPFSELRELRHSRTVQEQKVATLLCLQNSSCLLTPTICVDCRRALRLAGRRSFSHSHRLQVFCSFARRRCLRATHIFALCSDHCKKNNGNDERNAFVNPFWVERDLNPYIKPYRQYRSTFLATEITPIDSEHPLHTVLTPEVRQSPALTVSQEVEINNTASVSPPPSQSRQITPYPALRDTAPQGSASSIGTEVVESPSVPLSEGASPANHT